MGRVRDPWDRFIEKIETSEGCWIWKAARSSDGYGSFYQPHPTENRMHANGAHVYAYRELVGPIPDGMEIDHLCRDRACVNPLHLEAVTHQVNVQRGDAGRFLAETRPRFLGDGLCSAGLHNMGDPDNIRVRSDGTRQCGSCYDIASREWRRRGYRAANRSSPDPRSRTHCKKYGHPYSFLPSGKKYCKECNQMQQRELYHAKKAAA